MAHTHETHDDGGGFSAGVLIGIILLILVVIILLFYLAPNVFNVNVNVRSGLEALIA
jgi:hypothetical protein